jgi:FkbM family methyltransferase
MGKIISGCLVEFYRFWHGALHIRGAGALLHFASRWIPALRSYPVKVPGVGVIPLDFRMDYAYTWMNFLLNESHHERGLLTVLASHCSPTMVFWDVGANIGLITGNLIRAFPSATFCLFEPNPDLTKRLAVLFSGHDVSITETALSDQNTRARFNIVPGETSLATLLSAQNPKACGIDVELQTGDHFLSTHPASAPDLIKIDVEGHEVEVLRGCRELIAARKPVIVFEHLFLSDDSLKSLVPPEYDLFYIHDESGELSADLDRGYSHNAILIPRGKRWRSGSGRGASLAASDERWEGHSFQGHGGFACRWT